MYNETMPTGPKEGVPNLLLHGDTRYLPDMMPLTGERDPNLPSRRRTGMHCSLTAGGG